MKKMADVLAVWLFMVLALSLACNLAYICRDMARESRRERQRAQKTRRDSKMYPQREVRDLEADTCWKRWAL